MDIGFDTIEVKQEFDKLMDLGAGSIARDNGYEFTWATSEVGEDEKEFAQKHMMNK